MNIPGLGDEIVLFHNKDSENIDQISEAEQLKTL